MKGCKSCIVCASRWCLDSLGLDITAKLIYSGEMLQSREQFMILLSLDGAQKSGSLGYIIRTYLKNPIDISLLLSQYVEFWKP